jgi:sugar lactone lactonase YvrE
MTFRTLQTALLTSLFAVISLSLKAAPESSVPVFPELIPLPANFGPESIAAGKGHSFYVGSLAPATLGQILVGDLQTGAVQELVAPTGRLAAGMKFDARSDLLFVAGGPSGRATVYDAASGVEAAVYQFQPPGVPGINDVVVTREAAYFTDSTRPFLYRAALGPQGRPLDAQTIRLPTNFGTPGACTIGPGLRGNGIAATPNGKHLILVHMSEGRLYRMDTATNNLVSMALSGGDFAGGGAVCSTDGMLLDGHTLYAVQNVLNRIAMIELASDYLSGVITRYITEPFTSNSATKVPTGLAEFGDALYAVTAGFAPPTPDFVVRVSK